MKLAVVILACVAAASAQFNSGAYNNGAYNRFNSFNQYNRNQYRYPTTPSPFRSYPTYTPVAFTATTPAPLPSPTPVPVSVPVARVVADARNAQILKYGNEVNPDGSYAYFYETENGIAAQEQGVPRNFGGNPPVIPSVAQGSFSWTSPEGEPIVISYVADENGYQPSGAAIPTSPPIPAQIARALEYIARNAPKK